MLTSKQLQVAAIFASVAAITNISTVNTEEEWIISQSNDLTVKGQDLNNKKAIEVVNAKGLKLSNEECETTLENKDKIKFKDKYKVNHCKSKLKMK